MSATLHLVGGPPGPGLTARLRAEYCARCSAVGSCLWLAPTDRAADAARRLLAREAGPVLAPNVFSLRGLCEAVSAQSGVGPPTPSASARRRILAEAAADLARAGGLPFYERITGTRGFLDGADGFLTEMAAAGVAPDQFTGAGRGARSAKLTAIADLWAAFVRRSGGDADAVTRAAEVLRRGLPTSFARVGVVFVDGFVSFTPPEWAVLEALAGHAELWVAMPDDLRDAYSGVRDTRARLAGLFGDTRVVRLPPTPRDRPAGLAHLEANLFGNAGAPAEDATGLSLIEAAGPVGEARLVARRIRSLLADAVRADAIVVTARDLTYSRGLLGEVFAEYGVPAELDGAEPLLRNPAVATLLRALRLPEEGWPFAGVTALLRSTYFRPPWDEAADDTARRAEGLLRLLGEPRDRDAYLRAVRLWSETPPGGLEDEEAEGSRRRRKARLAADCRPFLERFFAAWDTFPTAGRPEVFADWLDAFARDIGLARTANEDAADRTAVRALQQGLGQWTGGTIPRSAFVRGLLTIAGAEPIPQPAASAGRVRVVPAEEARHLDCDYLFILGLGEKSFPRLAPPTSLLDDADRTILRQAGLPFRDPTTRLADEQLLFLELVARPRRGLVLSYPAVDEKGQPLLEGTFLRAVGECFAAGAIPVERQRMLIDGYATNEARSAAEARVQFAAVRCGRQEVPDHPGLPPNLCEHLRWAEQVATARFRVRDYNRFDGWVDQPTARAAVRDCFGPDKVISPTALDAYVACPFKFLLGHVLRLAELDEPGEEVEHARRGAAYHRALSRLHRKLHAADPEMTKTLLPEHIGQELLAEIDTAVAEYAARAPSPASRRLWELEGRRLHRSAARYRGHWDGFIDPWRKAKAYLSPDLLEADFGLQAGASSPLVISVDGVEVRIGGRIDRVDVAELDDGLGFWVIEYKTGRAANYTARGLAQFERLQLPLYALAVERVFFADRPARPLGLAYWMVTDTGPKPVLPGSRGSAAWHNEPEKWPAFRAQLEAWVAKLVGRIREGHFPLAPRSATCTETCSFGQVCRISQSRHTGKVWDLAPAGDNPG